MIWPMKRLQAFKFRLRPGGQQEREMRRFAGACRFVFNRALALQNENHEAGNKYIPYGKWLPGWLSGKMPLKRNGLKIRPHSHCNSH